MKYYANNALVYRNTAGLKVRAQAGTIVTDARESDTRRWEASGAAREATVGEIAEAVAAGTLSPAVLEGGAPTQGAGDGSDDLAAKIAADRAAAEDAAAKAASDREAMEKLAEQIAADRAAIEAADADKAADVDKAAAGAADTEEKPAAGKSARRKNLA